MQLQTEERKNSLLKVMELSVSECVLNSG